MMKLSAQKWFKIALGNLVIIAFLGLILRYKIAFSLPFIDQKHLLQAHSHFAFSGWITQALMILMVNFLSQRGVHNAFEKYNKLLLYNLIASYGMLLSFPFQGYGFVSISFSTLSILVAYTFAILFWKDLKRHKISEVSTYWFKASLFFNALSTLGAFSLSLLMANKIDHPNWYLAAIYFFLHFQYNGWFLFACGGLWFSKIHALKLKLKNDVLIFWMFATSCIPCYFLSTLWMKLPPGIYGVIVTAAFIQVIALVLLIKSITSQSHELKTKLLGIGKVIFLFSFIALGIKITLQLFSTIPSLNQLSYGFRPIVIGYLHLVLLGFISLFIIAYSSVNYILNYNKWMARGATIFIIGIVLNEILLLLQGASAMQLNTIPYNNELLLSAALVLFLGTLILFRSQIKLFTSTLPST